MEAAVAIHRSRLEREAADRLRESERRRIAMALHDSALQSLYAVGIQLDRARRRGLEHLTDTMTADVAVAAIQKSMAAIRGVLDALEERAHPGPGAALSEPARTTARLYGVELRWQGLEAIADLTQDRARELGLCLSEAVANAARHGGASEVFVHCRREDDGTVTLTIRDNGRGAPADGIREGHGLTHVRQRLAHIGGELRIAAGKEGVALECRLRPQAPATGDRGADGADSVASYDAPPVSSDAR
jgi:signal transduction histidine kinase